MGRRDAEEVGWARVRILGRIGLGLFLCPVAFLMFSCGTTEDSGLSMTSPAPTIDVAQTATPGTSCLLDPARGGDKIASIDYSTREVRVADGGNVTVAVPAYRTGPAYSGEAYSVPALAPSGEAIVVGAHFKQGDGTMLTGLWRIALQDLSRTLLLASDDARTFAVDEPAYSPDGGRIAFTRTNVVWRPTHGHDDTYEVWVMNADGSGARKVADGSAPIWSSDGRYLSFGVRPFQNGPVPKERTFLDAASFQPAPGVALPFCVP